MPVKHAMRKLRSPLKWHGGKSYLARRILAHFPEHDAYCEPFAGGLSILLNKPPSAVEVVGDLDADLMRFWGVMADPGSFPGFLGLVAGLPYSAEAFERARSALGLTPRPGSGPVEFAAHYLAWNRMSRGGLGKDFAWSDRLRGGRPGDLNAWETMLGLLPSIHRRLCGERARTVLAHGPAVETLRRFDSARTLFYCDPPYLHETRTAKDAYAHEMNAVQHAELLEVLDGLEGKVVLSGYHSRPYDERLKRWRLVEFDIANHSGQGKAKQRRTEVLWIKP